MGAPILYSVPLDFVCFGVKPGLISRCLHPTHRGRIKSQNINRDDPGRLTETANILFV
jgi:hypothetical protein